MINRIPGFLYGVASYLVFFLTFLYAAGFVSNVGVPKSIDSPRPGPLWEALLVDALLLALFAVQHSGMARPAFKKWWTRYVPVELERSTYVLFSSLALIALFVLWQPLGGALWSFEGPLGALLAGLGLLGWALVLTSTFLINHFDLFGLRQVWLYLLDRPYTQLSFKLVGPYRYVRHPLYVGWLFAFWGTPTMTVTHLFFSLVTTAYILMAIGWEERDLMAAHREYAEYRKNVPALCPHLRRQDAAALAVSA